MYLQFSCDYARENPYKSKFIAVYLWFAHTHLTSLVNPNVSHAQRWRIKCDVLHSWGHKTSIMNVCKFRYYAETTNERLILIQSVQCLENRAEQIYIFLFSWKMQPLRRDVQQYDRRLIVHHCLIQSYLCILKQARDMYCQSLSTPFF